MGFAKYTNDNGIIKKDGHTMFSDDIAKELNRKSFLEGKILQSAPPTNTDMLKLLSEIRGLFDKNYDYITLPKHGEIYNEINAVLAQQQHV
jgi:hypothetical protein